MGQGDLVTDAFYGSFDNTRHGWPSRSWRSSTRFEAVGASVAGVLIVEGGVGPLGWVARIWGGDLGRWFCRASRLVALAWVTVAG
jgi:hypothetical protein